MANCKSSIFESCLSYVKTRSAAESTVFVALFYLFAFSANIKGSGTSKLLSIIIILLIIFPED